MMKAMEDDLPTYSDIKSKTLWIHSIVYRLIVVAVVLCVTTFSMVMSVGFSTIISLTIRSRENFYNAEAIVHNLKKNNERFST